MNTSQNRVVAIHQPNFFPWLGYFNKIALSDIFVVMDNVQFPRTGGGNWLNRVQLMINGHATWFTMPVVRAFHGLRNINEMQIDNSKPWRNKLLKTIEMNYVRAPFFSSVFPVLREIISTPTNLLVEYNLSAINQLRDLFGLQSQLILGSSLGVDGAATELLISMVRAVEGTAYLSGGGATGYQEDEQFAEAGMALVYQNFKHPKYRQTRSKEFVPGLSIIDSLMNCGLEQTKMMIQGFSSQHEQPS